MIKQGSAKPVELKLYAPQAKKVIVSGDFNKWSTRSIAAKKDSKGTWKAKMNLKPGRYEYKFLVDGNWQNDPNCHSCVYNSFGSQNCVLAVS